MAASVGLPNPTPLHGGLHANYKLLSPHLAHEGLRWHQGILRQTLQRRGVWRVPLPCLGPSPGSVNMILVIFWGYVVAQSPQSTQSRQYEGKMQAEHEAQNAPRYAGVKL